jgi:hypothetical protein
LKPKRVDAEDLFFCLFSLFFLFAMLGIEPKTSHNLILYHWAISPAGHVFSMYKIYIFFMQIFLQNFYQIKTPHFVKEAECSGNITYSCIKMEKWDLLKLFQEWRNRIKENDGGGEFNYDTL